MMKFIRHNLRRILFIGLLLPYLSGYIFIDKYLPKIEEINNTVIDYSYKAQEGYKAYGVYENIDEILAEKEAEIKESISNTASDFKGEIKEQLSVENAGSIISSLLKKETPEELKNIEDNVKDKAAVNFDFDIDIEGEIAKQPSHEIIDMIIDRLENNELFNYMNIAIMTPVFSVVSIIILILSNILHVLFKRVLTEKERVFLFNINNFWMTTFSISIIGLFVYFVNVYGGLAILAVANVYYILHCLQGILGFNTKHCNICGHIVSDEKFRKKTIEE